MALRFIDGFDSYITADLPKKGYVSGGTVTISPATGRRGTQSCVLGSGTAATLTKTLDNQATWIIGLAFRAILLPSITRNIVRLQDTGNIQVQISLRPDGTLEVTRAGTALTNGVSTAALVINTYYYLEWKCTIANSITADSCVVRLNGLPIITVAAGQDTQNTANAYANQILLGPNGTTGTTWDYDDLYVCDGSGSSNNNFLGDCRVDTLLPTSDGTSQQWTPSTAGAHWLLVDDAAPNTTDYVSSNTIGQRDTYGVQDIATITGTIYGVQLALAALKSDAGARSIKPLVLSGASEALGPATALGTGQSYTLYVQSTDPATATEWTEAGINALQCGAEVA